MEFLRNMDVTSKALLLKIAESNEKFIETLEFGPLFYARSGPIILEEFIEINTLDLLIVSVHKKILEFEVNIHEISHEGRRSHGDQDVRQLLELKYHYGNFLDKFNNLYLKQKERQDTEYAQYGKKFAEVFDAGKAPEWWINLFSKRGQRLMRFYKHLHNFVRN